MEDYMKVICAMVRSSEAFSAFMHTPSKEKFYDFCEELDEFDDFNVVVENSEISVRVFHGATKACFYVDGWSTLIKIGFSDFKVNHAAREADMYSEACKYGVAQFLVPCKKIGKFFGTPVFETDFIEVDEALVTSDMWNRCSGSMSNDEISSLLDDDDQYISVLFPFYYYEDEVTKFCDFLSEFGINDIHSGNIGYDSDGRIKVIDYSGYYPYGYAA